MIRIGFLICLLSLGACVRVQSNVQSFSALPSDFQGKSVTVLAFDEAANKTLEFKAYKTQLEGKLGAEGFLIEGADDADYYAFFGYSIDEGKEVQTTYSIPRYGVTGYTPSYTTGTISTLGGNIYNYSGTTTYTPNYGVIGYSRGVRSSTVFTRSVSVKMVEKASQEEVWSMQLSSSGSCGRVQPVMKPMLDAAFKEFPNTSGMVEIQLEKSLDC